MQPGGRRRPDRRFPSRGSGCLRQAGADAHLGRAPSVSTAERLTLPFGSNWGAASNVVRGDQCSSLAGPRPTSAEAPFATREAGTELREWGGEHPDGSDAGTDRTPQGGRCSSFGLAQRATPARARNAGFAAAAGGVVTWVGSSELAERPARTFRRLGRSEQRTPPWSYSRSHIGRYRRLVRRKSSRRSGRCRRSFAGILALSAPRGLLVHTREVAGSKPAAPTGNARSGVTLAEGPVPIGAKTRPPRRPSAGPGPPRRSASRARRPVA